MNIQEAIESFREKLSAYFDAETRSHYSSVTPDTVELEVSTKFTRVARVSPGHGGRSAYAFIAMEDGNNKALGHYKAGDIFKPAGWKGPAKHARGNVFDAEPLKCCGLHGVAYLR
jgi:hypothetical protein